MRALVLGARGAVGRVVAEDLRSNGHEVTPAGRTPGAGGAQIDLTGASGRADLRRASEGHDVIINASGIEDPSIIRFVGASVLVDISATAAYLDALVRQSPQGTGLVAGAGLVPGLSTVLLSAVDTRPGDEIDLAIVLGGGEAHGSAAVDWTANLAGRPLHNPPEGGRVVNFRERRRLPGPFGQRAHVRADFPDHLLVGDARGVSVRSYLATDNRISTAALSLVGRFPSLRGAVRRAPHVGGTGWSLTVFNRRTGETLAADGDGQSRTTGILTSRMAAEAVGQSLSEVTTAERLLDLDDVRELPGIRVSRPGSD